MAPRNRRRIVAALSDIHSGFRLGLLNPDVVLVREADDGSIKEWTPGLTTTQVELWKAYLDNIESLIAYAGSDEIIVVHGGDVTHGERYDGGIPDVTLEDQRIIAAANLTPLVELPNVRLVRLVTGTTVHVPNSAEARVSKRLADDTGKDVQCKHHIRASVDGAIFDIAHHGPHPGTRDWLKGNVARYYLRDRIYLDRRNGRQPAKVYLRGHFHEYVPETVHETWCGETSAHHLVILPSFSGLTDFARKVTRGTPTLTTGIVAFPVVNGVMTKPEPFVQTWDLRSEEML